MSHKRYQETQHEVLQGQSAFGQDKETGRSVGFHTEFPTLSPHPSISGQGIVKEVRNDTLQGSVTD